MCISLCVYIYIMIYYDINRKSLAKPPPKTYPRLRSHLGCSKPCHLLHSSTRSDLSPRHDLNLTRWWFPDLTHTLLPWENDNNSNPGASEASFPPKKNWSIGVTYKNYKRHQLDKSNQIKSVYYVWVCLKIDSVPLNPMANHHYLHFYQWSFGRCIPQVVRNNKSQAGTICRCVLPTTLEELAVHQVAVNIVSRQGHRAKLFEVKV